MPDARLDAGDPFDLVGDVLDGQFRVDQYAGEGDLSVVYRGHHLGVDAPVAIKCLNLPQTLDPKLLEPFLASFREGARLHYRLAQGNLHIAQSIAFGSTLAPRTGGTIPYLVREWLDGCSLAADFAARTKRRAPKRTVVEVLELLETAADALSYAHAQGVAHHSINPRNLFLTSTARGVLVKLLDFGVARVLNEHSVSVRADALDAPQVGLRIMFPTYAAPEQLDRQFALGGASGGGATTDVYSFALVVYEALAGKPVLPASSQAADVLRTFRPGERPSARALGIVLRPEVEAVLDRALALDPNLRPANAGEFWRELKEAATAGAPASVSLAPAATKRPSTSIRLPAIPRPTHAPAATTLERQPPVLLPSLTPAPAAASVPAAPPVAPPPPAPPPPPAAREVPAVQEPAAAPLPATVVDARPTEPLPPPPAAPEVLLAPAVPAPAAIAPVVAIVPPYEPSPSAPQVFASSTRADGGADAPAFPPPRAWWPLLQRHWVLPASFLATVTLGLAAFGAVRALTHRAPAPARAATTTTPANAIDAPATPLATAPPPSPPPAATVAIAAPQVPPIQSDAPATADAPRAFDRDEARLAFDRVAATLPECATPRGPRGLGSVRVRFENDGHIARVTIGPPYAGTPAGECIAERFQAVSVPPFRNGPTAFNYTFDTIPWEAKDRPSSHRSRHRTTSKSR